MALQDFFSYGFASAGTLGGLPNAPVITTGAVSSIVTGTLDTSSTISGSNQPHIQAATAVNQPEAAHTHPLGGSGTPLNVVNPYIVVHMWKRTA